MKPPRTDIPALDEYYRKYDTQAHIQRYNLTAEYERARDAVKKYWHSMGTPKSETKYAERYLQDPEQVENLVK